MCRCRDYHGKLWFPCTYVVSLVSLQSNMVLKPTSNEKVPRNTISTAPSSSPVCAYLDFLHHILKPSNRLIHRWDGTHPDPLKCHARRRMNVLPLNTDNILLRLPQLLPLENFGKRTHTQDKPSKYCTRPCVAAPSTLFLQFQTINCVTIKLSRSGVAVPTISDPCFGRLGAG